MTIRDVSDRVIEMIQLRSARAGSWSSVLRPEEMQCNDSDLDLLVEMKTDVASRERARRIHRVFDPYPCPMDIVVCTPAEVKRWAQAPASLVATALRERLGVHERN